MLQTADSLPLDRTERQKIEDLRSALNPPDGWSEDALARAPIDKMTAWTNSFLRSLQRHVSADLTP